jgi:hypothetical protein
MVVVDRIALDSFTEFVRGVEPRLRVGLCLAFGRETGLEATSYALAYGWENWDRVSQLANPAGYLWGVGRPAAGGYQSSGSWRLQRRMLIHGLSQDYLRRCPG